MGPTRRLLSDGTGSRWHWQHGPIDLILSAEGEGAVVAHEAAWQRFQTVLPELVAELPLLRSPVRGDPCLLQGAVARRMWEACAPFAREGFITPMAAVAGSVAQELIAHYRRPNITRAWINNGGDIALHLAPGQSARVGLFADLARLAPGAVLDGRFELHAESGICGVATSGWRGRSFSMGIADSVTILARTAAMADAAATVVANAVNVDDPRIQRRPACTLKDDSDLGELPVTVDVPPLAPTQVQSALRSGAQRALQLRDRGLVHAAVLCCQGFSLVVEPAAPKRIPQAEVGSVLA